jgi:hypothetical protein
MAQEGTSTALTVLLVDFTSAIGQQQLKFS